MAAMKTSSASRRSAAPRSPTWATSAAGRPAERIAGAAAAASRPTISPSCRRWRDVSSTSDAGAAAPGASASRLRKSAASLAHCSAGVRFLSFPKLNISIVPAVAAASRPPSRPLPRWRHLPPRRQRSPARRRRPRRRRRTKKTRAPSPAAAWRRLRLVSRTVRRPFPIQPPTSRPSFPCPSDRPLPTPRAAARGEEGTGRRRRRRARRRLLRARALAPRAQSARKRKQPFGCEKTYRRKKARLRDVARSRTSELRAIQRFSYGYSAKPLRRQPNPNSSLFFSCAATADRTSRLFFFFFCRVVRSVGGCSMLCAHAKGTRKGGKTKKRK